MCVLCIELCACSVRATCILRAHYVHTEVEHAGSAAARRHPLAAHRLELTEAEVPGPEHVGQQAGHVGLQAGHVGLQPEHVGLQPRSQYVRSKASPGITTPRAHAPGLLRSEEAEEAAAAVAEKEPEEETAAEEEVEEEEAAVVEVVKEEEMVVVVEEEEEAASTTSLVALPRIASRTRTSSRDCVRQ